MNQNENHTALNIVVCPPAIAHPLIGINVAPHSDS